MALDCVTEYFENYSNSEATEVVYLADVDLPGLEWDTTVSYTHLLLWN